MNLIPSKGFRTAYTVTEIAQYVGVTRDTVKSWIRRGVLKREHSGRFCIMQKDANALIQSINNGRMCI